MYNMYSIYSHGLFFNFFIWNIKTLIFFKKIFKLIQVNLCNPRLSSLTESNLQIRSDNYGLYTIILNKIIWNT